MRNPIRPSLNLAALVLGTSFASGQYTFDRVALESRVSLADLGVLSVVDCWGYVSPTGREYAVLCTSNGTAFIEITDPSVPVIVHQERQEPLGKDVKVYRHYAYTSSDAGPSYVMDLSQIDSGIVTSPGFYDENGTHNLAVDEVSGFLYHAVGGPLRFFDLTDPLAPALVGSWPGETHDVQVVTYTSGPYDGRQIAFVFAGTQGRVDIVDVTNKAAPFRVSEVSYPDAEYTHQGWLSEDRRWLYVNDELDGIPRTSIFDVSVLEEPSWVGDYSNGGTSTDHNLYWRDGYLFVANYTMGMRVFDARDPVNLAEVGWFDTFPANNNTGFIGAWTAYPFFPSGTVIVSDQSNGLFVLDATEATTPAGVAFRNAGANPGSYTATSPVLGATWSASVDLGLTGHTLGQVFGYSSSASVPLAGGQQLLVGGARRFRLPARSGPVATWNAPIPNESAFAGVSLFTQAIHFGGVVPYALSNAQDLTVGYY